MRPAFCLLLVLLSCWQALSAGLDPGSGDGPAEDSRSSSSVGTSSTVRAVPEGSGSDDEDSVVPSSVTAAVTTASAATSSASRSIVTTTQASDGGDDEGSGASPVRHRCDSGTTELSGCYCVDEANREILGTRGRADCKPVEEETITPRVAVTYGRSVSPSVMSTRMSTGEIVIDEDSTIVSVPSPAATSSVPITSHTSTAAVQTTTVTMTTTASTTAAAPSTLATTTTTMPPPPSAAVVTTAVSTRTSTLKPTTSRYAPSSTVRHVHAHPTTTLSNEVPYYAEDKDAAGKEAKEESDNQINAAAEPLNRGASHESSAGLHPGLLAAIIGGGVVGLLCAILLIMFIVYRMRKKDEGSYPLDDGKPRALYKSPPSKEFYA